MCTLPARPALREDLPLAPREAASHTARWLVGCASSKSVSAGVAARQAGAPPGLTDGLSTARFIKATPGHGGRVRTRVEGLDPRRYFPAEAGKSGNMKIHYYSSLINVLTKSMCLH